MVEQSMAILLLLLLAGALDEVAGCVDNVPASNEWIQSETLGSLQVHGDIDDGLLAVMPNYTFSCEGVVIQWIVQWHLEQWIVRWYLPELSDSCEIVFDFHVLRPTGSCSVTSIGKNRMVVETGVVTEDTMFISTFNILLDSERIQVREGDMVGLAVTYNQTYENSCSFRRLTIAEQDDTSSLLTNEVHYVQKSFDPDSITEFELDCSREHSDDDDDESTRPRGTGTRGRGTRSRGRGTRTRSREHSDDDDDESTRLRGTGTWSRGRGTRSRRYDRDNFDGSPTHRPPITPHTHGGDNFEATDFLVSYRTPLINAVVESIEVQPTTSLDTKSTTFSETKLTTQPPPTQTNRSTIEIPGTSPEIITDPDTQDGEQESESNMMIPISVVVATIGGLLIATTGVITIVCVCYCFRERKKTGDQPDCAISENKAYSLQLSPTYDIKCVNPIYENDDEYIYMSPEKGIAVDQKKPLSPPQQYSMKCNAAYDTSSLSNTSTTATAATIVKELSRSFRSQKPTASVGKYVGNCFIVEDSVYEVPQ